MMTDEVNLTTCLAFLYSPAQALTSVDRIIVAVVQVLLALVGGQHPRS